MQPLIAAAKEVAARIRQESRLIHIVSHFDADGIASGAIFTRALLQLAKPFHLIITKQIKPELIARLKTCEPALVIFADIGSGYLNELEKLGCDVIVADHHEIAKVWTDRRLWHINPKLFGMSDLSGSVISYIIGRELNADTAAAALALVGAIGDLATINPAILDSSAIKVERGLRLYGRLTKPLHTALATAGIDESTALALLAELGIAPQNSKGWRTLADLSTAERQRLADALIREKVQTGQDISELFGDVWTLKGWPAELADAAEFATLLNACGRLERADVGIAICLGNIKALETGRELLGQYKRTIAAALEWLELNPRAIMHGQGADYILAGNAIGENFIGTVVSIVSRSMSKPLVGLAVAGNELKVSARCRAGIDINKVVSTAAAEVGGSAGGHHRAAGAMIPAGSERQFIEACERLLGQKTL